jgi:AraC-like DNA-binding protein
MQERGEGVETFARCCSVIMKPAGAVHSNRLGDTGARSLVLEFDPEWLAGVGAATPAQMRVSTSVPAAAIVLRLRKTLLDAATPGNAKPVEDGVIDLIELLESEARRFAPTATHTGIPDAVREHIERDPCASDKFEQLAGELGVHQVSLSRSFRHRFGRTPVEHRRLLRIQRAAEWIASSRTPLAHVAIRAGFSDQSHLTRAFSRDLGVSPGQFREYAIGI